MLPPKPNKPAPRPPLTLAQLERDEGLVALHAAFPTAADATRVLNRIDFPAAYRPNHAGYPDGDAYWREVCRQVEQGRTEGGLEALMAAATHFFPHSRVFPQYVQQVAPLPITDAEANHGVSLFIISGRRPSEVLDEVRRVATTYRLPGQVRLEMSTDTGLAVFGFDQASAEEVQRIAEEIPRLLAPTPHAGPVRVNLSANGDRSTILERLYAEGPDGRRFELFDVPANTTPQEIARGVMGEYTDTGAPTGTTDPKRKVVVNAIRPEGPQRLNPDQPIGRQGLRDGDQVEVLPESRAGVDANTRLEALKRARNEVIAFCTARPGITPEVPAGEEITPTQYTLAFEANSWAPPPASGQQPVPITQHEVLIDLPSEFPIRAPLVRWLTPIFHPNVFPDLPADPRRRMVCLGELMEHYEPGLDFGKLLQMLLEIAAYRNYDLQSFVDPDARRWAHSREGQIAIEQRGGISWTRDEVNTLIDALPATPRFGIKKLAPQ